MPPPVPYSTWRHRLSTMAVRIATLKRALRSGLIIPTAPVYRRRGPSSRSAMMRIVLIFGAPVIDAQGNKA